MDFNNFIQELKRRNVFRVATAYAIAGWLIIQITDTVFPRMGLPDWTITFVIYLTGIGFPITLIIAWAFELTPQGLKTTKEVDQSESITHNTGKKINKLIIGAMSLLIVFLLSERIFFAESTILEQNSRSVQSASIAVLPFVNMSNDEGNEYFSDGLSEELLNGLAKIQELQVAGRTSSFQFKGSNPDLRDVGDQLGVQHILEGSVRKSGNRLRITAQLIQADNGFHLWSETYDRELTAQGVFDIQEEITRQVVSELKIRLLPQEEELIADRPTQDIEAYNAFLEATQREITRQPDDIEYAIRKYKEAVRLDPSFSLAYGRMGYAYTLQYLYGNIPLEEAKQEARRSIDQALMLNGNEGKAYQAMSSYYRNLEKDHEQALKTALRAVDLMPNDAMANNALLLSYRVMNQEEKGNEIIQKAYALDPLNPVVKTNYALYRYRQEHFEESLELLDEVTEQNPEYSSPTAHKAWILSQAPFGQIDEAFILTYESFQNDKRDRNLISSLIDMSHRLELVSVARDLTNEMNRLYPDNDISAFWNFLGHAFASELDSAEQVADRYFEQFGNDSREENLYATSILYYNQGRPDAAKAMIEEFHPAFRDSTIELQPADLYVAALYYKMLREEGSQERANYFEQQICSFSAKQAEQQRSEEKYVQAHFNSIMCDLIQGDKEELLKILETNYFEKKQKAGWADFSFFNGFLYKDLLEDPSIEPLKARIDADLARMRNRVENYLKSEGDWKPSWEDAK